MGQSNNNNPILHAVVLIISLLVQYERPRDLIVPRILQASILFAFACGVLMVAKLKKDNTGTSSVLSTRCIVEGCVCFLMYYLLTALLQFYCFSNLSIIKGYLVGTWEVVWSLVEGSGEWAADVPVGLLITTIFWMLVFPTMILAWCIITVFLVIGDFMLTTASFGFFFQAYSGIQDRCKVF
eukprot:gnl/MRDRNA2_/MRDRNA2_174195_c0_seq1.p1 gnl/MRDRNA2_/MRDRNA2_174195_c0~~gnl/MRDRNA2_/MRDRNA2_174195_c0_seq1.p1  ORF type:complete len:182 (+),score=16.52 gnl/MRDRNA2_/MRDRNA2_174195_c0_seq1:68-613(+)